MAKYAMTGFAGSGKDTVADILAQELGQKTYALAEPIYQLTSKLFNITREYMADRATKELELVYLVDVTSLEAAGMYYNEIGLDAYLDFQDAWQQWIPLLGLIQVGEHYQATISVRKMLQLMGTEWGRNLHDTIWMELAPENHIITDVRFDDEAEFFKAANYDILEVVRDNHTQISESSHSSENGILPYLVDTTIYNDGTLKDLHEKVVFYLLHDDPIGMI